MNVKLPNSQLNKIKSAKKKNKKNKKNETDVILRLSPNMIGNLTELHSDDRANLPHKLLLTNRQVANLRKAFASHTSNDIKLSKSQ